MTTTTTTVPPLHVALHTKYLKELNDDKTSFEYVMTEHLRMQGVFWALGARSILGVGVSEDATERKEILDWVMRCYDAKRGGFGGNEGHDAHLLYTQHALYILAMLDALEERLDEGERERVVRYITSLQNPEDGSFHGDEWGEIDTRYSYCAVSSLAVLGRLDALDARKTSEYVISTRNELDGGFGACRGVESHAGYVFTALATLSILDGYRYAARGADSWDSLAWWLSERQCDSGGLNGRPEKLADVCYSWWVLSSLVMLGRSDWIDQDKLGEFILRCQDLEQGGIADHIDNVGDVYHTFFGLCGLSMMGRLGGGVAPGGEPVDPVFALPRKVCERLGLQWVRSGSDDD